MPLGYATEVTKDKTAIIPDFKETHLKGKLIPSDACLKDVPHRLASCQAATWTCRIP
jgi:hypothetical protein